jgi:hypothetical protein
MRRLGRGRAVLEIGDGKIRKEENGKRGSGKGGNWV